MSTRTIGTVLASLTLVGATTIAEQPNESRFVLLDASGDAYRAVGGTPAGDDTSSNLRLVVLRDGRISTEHPLVRHESTSTERDAKGNLLRIEQIARDEAWITEGGAAAVISRARYTIERPLDTNGRVDPDLVRFRAREVALEWFDVEKPDGRWREVLPDGTAVGAVHLLDSAHGVGVVLTRDDTAEFIVLSRDGRMLTVQRGLIATNPDVRIGPDGTVLAVDLAYASRAGLPDRAVHVVNLTGGGSWSYTWTYGSDREPVSWQFDKNGDLLFETVDTVYRYRPDGRPVRSRSRF